MDDQRRSELATAAGAAASWSGSGTRPGYLRRRVPNSCRQRAPAGRLPAMEVDAPSTAYDASTGAIRPGDYGEKVPETAAGAASGDGRGSADRMRQHRQSDLGPKHGTAARDPGAARSGRQPRAHCAAIVYGKSDPVAHG